jgi:hypothetical protein
MRDITKIDNYSLLGHFADAVMDKNYNPSSKDYNQSGFLYEELEAEILRRLAIFAKFEE